MANSARLNTLTLKHTDLDFRIAEEMRSPLPDHLRISDLKKQKLLIKDQLEQLSATA